MAAKYAFIAMVALGIAGCASIPKGDPDMDLALSKFPTKPDVASVYIYCDEWMGAVFFTNVAVDGEPLGQVGSYTYLHTEVPPGKHKVTSVAANTDLIEFDADGGRIYYIWQEKKWSWLIPEIKLHVMSEVDGQKGVRRANFRVASYRTEDQGGAKFAIAAGASTMALFTVFFIYAIPGMGAAAILAGAH
jgi:hypothetical protein